MTQKFLMGRIETIGDRKVVVPIQPIHKEVALRHQQTVAALIAAAYLFKGDGSVENLALLKEAARSLA